MNIKFGANRPATIFSDIAEQAAKWIKTDPETNKINKDNNKTTQLRKFYDELTMWNERVQTKGIAKEEEYKKLEAFIKMLKAKVAYAEGRKHINSRFSGVFNQCIDQVHCAETLKDAKLFMEAVMGYCKLFELKLEESL
ncbi:type III-A CRISPR-associated protein Csm2 [Pasteurellaceae bacterium LFhippo2]|nr:type III-A CRISPR-associated protein Csm2 [Pasteurellaceae bacterium LFhippo2]